MEADLDEESADKALSEAFRKADALSVPLDEKLKLYLARSRELFPEIEASYDQLVLRVAEATAEEHLPAIGDALPGFLLPDSDGGLVSLEALLEKGPLVISFNRGPWCGYCGLELRALSRAYPEITAAGADAISIVPETGQYARNLQATWDVPFRVLIDVDLAYALTLGLVFSVGEKIKEMYRGLGIDLERFQGHSGWFLPIPATIIVGQDGRVRGRYVDPDFRHRMRIEDIMHALA